MPVGGSFVFIILATFSSLHPLIEMTSDLRAILYNIVHTHARCKTEGLSNIKYLLLVSVLLFKSLHSIMFFAFTFYSFTNWSDV